MFRSFNVLLVLKIVRLYFVIVIFKLFNGLYRINFFVDFLNFKLLFYCEINKICRYIYLVYMIK